MKRTLSDILSHRGGQKHINYTLDRMVSALKSIGSPQNQTKTFIVGGTNGKGSTTLLISSVLRHAGFKVGTYLSPHLECPTERFLVGLTPVEIDRLTYLANQLDPVGERYQLTYFEFLTLLYFVWAKEENFDFSVVEVGLGGKLDATNVGMPLASVLTNVDLDHIEFLGKTKIEILQDKMEIFRPEGLVFSAITDPELLGRLQFKCDELDAIYYLSKEIRKKTLRRDWEGQVVTLNDYCFNLPCPSLGMLNNASLAFLFSRIMFPKIPVETLPEAFDSLRVPARFEVVQESPRVVLSADHNPAGILDLSATLSELECEKPHIVCGFSNDKPYQTMYKSLAEMAKSILLTQIPGQPAPPQGYTDLGPFEPSPEKAVEKTIAAADSEDTILITGSIYLTGGIRKLWKDSVRFLADRPQREIEVKPYPSTTHSENLTPN